MERCICVFFSYPVTVFSYNPLFFFCCDIFSVIFLALLMEPHALAPRPAASKNPGVFAERVLTDAQNDGYWFAVLLQWGAHWGEGWCGFFLVDGFAVVMVMVMECVAVNNRPLYSAPVLPTRIVSLR
jgi:hypothetical protein